MPSLNFPNISGENQLWFQAIEKSGMKLGLENMQKLLQALGNPEAKLCILHCAGTNGKGSTLMTLEQLLVHSGYRVGTTTSPHLVSLNERIRLQQKPISDDLLNELLNQIRSVCGAASSANNPDNWKLAPTFFEIIIAAAFLSFQQAKVDIALIETGLGGRLDATNLVQAQACLLTSISLDHEKILGNSLVEIATEKLGIVKTSAPVFSAKQVPEVQKKIEQHCTFMHAPCWVEGADFGFSQHNSDQNFYTFTHPKPKLSLNGLGLKGKHQWNNTALALAVYFHQVPQERWLSKVQIQKCLHALQFSGRMQMITAKPHILLDGAHNPASVEALVKYLEENYANQKLLVAMGWLKDKKIPLEIFSQLKPDFQPLLFEERPQPSLNEYPKCTTVLPSLGVQQFANQCQAGAYQKDYDQIVITGSLYLAGAFLSCWELLHKK